MCKNKHTSIHEIVITVLRKEREGRNVIIIL